MRGTITDINDEKRLKEVQTPIDLNSENVL